MSIKEIIPILAAIIGLTPVFLKWLNDRSTEAAKRRAVQQAKEKVEFWQTWLQAKREVSTDNHFSELKIKVSRHLDELILQDITTENQIKNAEHDKKRHSFFQKFLLAYFPHTTSGWIFHTLYYITISFIIMFIYISFYPADDVNGDPSWSNFVSDLDFVLISFLFFAAIAFGLHRLAIRSEKRYFKKINTEET